jgi:hypothetical protein
MRWKACGRVESVRVTGLGCSRNADRHGFDVFRLTNCAVKSAIPRLRGAILPNRIESSLRYGSVVQRHCRLSLAKAMYVTTERQSCSSWVKPSSSSASSRSSARPLTTTARWVRGLRRSRPPPSRHRRQLSTMPALRSPRPPQPNSRAATGAILRRRPCRALESGNAIVGSDPST